MSSAFARSVTEALPVPVAETRLSITPFVIPPVSAAFSSPAAISSDVVAASRNWSAMAPAACSPTNATPARVANPATEERPLATFGDVVRRSRNAATVSIAAGTTFISPPATSPVVATIAPSPVTDRCTGSGSAPNQPARSAIPPAASARTGRRDAPISMPASTIAFRAILSCDSVVS